MQSIDAARDGLVTAGGLRLHYREWGDPGAPDVLILHGLTGHAWEFDGLAEHLSDRFHVVSLNQRGHGDSDHASSYTPDVMAGDIGLVIDALGLSNVRIIGHSMGGVNGWLFASRRPDLVERLVIIDIGPDVLESEEAQSFWRERFAYYQLASYDDPEEAVAAYLGEDTGPTAHLLRTFVLDGIRQRDDGKWVWKFDADRLYSFIDGASDTAPLWQALSNVTCPTLIIRAGDSWALSDETFERMCREVPNARCIEVADCGHDVHFDQPERLLTALDEFLR